MIRMPISHQIASIIHISCGTCTSRDFIQLFSRLFLDVRKVAYALLTHPPLVSSPKTLLPFDLHVLSLPQAFILSQDQTLHCKKLTLLLLSQVVAKFVCLYATYSLIAVPQKPLVTENPLRSLNPSSSLEHGYKSRTLFSFHQISDKKYLQLISLLFYKTLCIRGLYRKKYFRLTRSFFSLN